MDASVFIWSFPGGIWGASLAAAFLVAAAALSYAFPIRKGSVWAKVLLGALRLFFFGLLLWCLCAPAKVVEKRDEKTAKPKIALVLDESSSMTQKGAQGRSRLDDAKAELQDLLKAKSEAFDFKLFAFSDSERELASVDEAGQDEQGKLKSTELYKSVADLARKLSSGCKAAICLTDGVDTSSSGRLEQALDALESGAPPFIFKTMKLPLKSKATVEIDRIEAPPAAKVDTSPTVTIALRCSGLDPAEPLEIAITRNGKFLRKEKIEVASRGTFTKAASFSVPIKAAELQSFEAKASCGSQAAATARWSINGIEEGRLKVLLYMGSLDWGMRFMKRAFDASDRISLDVKYAPDFLGSRTGTAPKTSESFVKPEELESYDAIVFMNLRRHQIPPELEAELSNYIEGGGALLFVVANTETAAEYANSPVEKFLPAVFEKSMEGNDDPQARQFVERMARYREGLMMERTARRKPGTLELPPLSRFQITEPGLHSGVFNYAMNAGALNEAAVPAFEDFAFVRALKPGGEALAAHPFFKDAEGNPRTLLAVQRFGQGRSALMACDPLWRWRMSMDSRSSFYESFWAHLASWLCAGRESQPHWKLNSLVLEAGKPAELRFAIPPRTLKFSELEFSTECAGKSRPLAMHPTERPDEFKAETTPEPGRTATLLAKRSGEIVAVATFSGGPAPEARELEMLRPDSNALRRMAAACGGALVDRLSDIDLRKFENSTEDAPVVREESPLWRASGVFAALLAAFCCEMALRRAFRLL